MKAKTLRTRLKPHLWYQAYWVVYLIWFFWLDLTVTDPKYIIHSPVDDLIPFNECSFFRIAVGSCCWRRSRPCCGGSIPPAMTSSA